MSEIFAVLQDIVNFQVLSSGENMHEVQHFLAGH